MAHRNDETLVCFYQDSREIGKIKRDMCLFRDKQDAEYRIHNIAMSNYPQATHAVMLQVGSNPLSCTVRFI